MKIINRANGRETTIRNAVAIVADRGADALGDIVVRLLEELCEPASGSATLRPQQLARILEYGFDVEGEEGLE